MFQAKRRFCAVAGIFLAGCALGMAVQANAASLAVLPPGVGLAQLFAPDARSGVALYGFDPVTYFLIEGPRPGQPEHEIIWSGLAWRFSSAANREAFARDPEAYAPRLGGYDATAAAGGLVVEANPLLFAVRAEGLYLFRSDHARARFMADESIAQRAEQRWSDLKKELIEP